MILTNEQFLDSLIDLKNLFIYSEWYEGVIKLFKEPKKISWKRHMYVEKRAVITDMYFLGLTCLPIGWTTFSPTILKSIFKDLKHILKPLYNAYGFKTYKAFIKDKTYAKAYKWWKFYLNGFVTARTDKQHHAYKKFQLSTKLNKQEQSKYALQYLDLLNSYIKEKTPLYDVCKQARLIIMAMFK